MSHWRGAARAVDAQIVQHLPDLLASKSNADTQRLACEILGNLAIHKSSGVVAVGVELYARIVSLLRYLPKISRRTYITNPRSNKHSIVCEGALSAVAKIAFSRQGAEVAGATGIWEHFPELLDPPSDPRTLRFTCSILGNLAVHESASLTLLGSRSYLRIVSLLRCFHNAIFSSK
jgi:hypothetical protein